MTTVGEWLASRAPAPPPALWARIEWALGDALTLDQRETADVCLAAGERVLGTVLREDGAARDCALDLLTADALVTYAFETEGESPADIAVRAAGAMLRIAALGGTPPKGVDA